MLCLLSKSSSRQPPLKSRIRCRAASPTAVDHRWSALTAVDRRWPPMMGLGWSWKFADRLFSPLWTRIRPRFSQNPLTSPRILTQIPKLQLSDLPPFTVGWVWFFDMLLSVPHRTFSPFGSCKSVRELQTQNWQKGELLLNFFFLLWKLSIFKYHFNQHGF